MYDPMASFSGTSISRAGAGGGRIPRTAELKHCVEFAGRKLSAVRWIDVGALSAPGLLVTGSADEPVRGGAGNALQLWQASGTSTGAAEVQVRQLGGGLGVGSGVMTNQPTGVTSLATMHNGGAGCRVLASFENGDVSLVEVKEAQDVMMMDAGATYEDGAGDGAATPALELELKATWRALHGPKQPGVAWGSGPPGPVGVLSRCACTAVTSLTDCFDPSESPRFATVGEDGRIFLMTADGPDIPRCVVRTWEAGARSGATINGVAFRGENELFTANSFGQLQQWDTRERAPDEPAQTYTDDAADGDGLQQLYSVAVHTTDPRKIFTGSSDGTLSVWDVRMPAGPVPFPETLIQAHDSDTAIWSIRFHPELRDHAFTAAEDGKLLHWRWDSSGVEAFDPASADLLMPADLSRMEVRPMMPNSSGLGVNDVDVSRDMVACVTDDETLMVFEPRLR